MTSVESLQAGGPLEGPAPGRRGGYLGRVLGVAFEARTYAVIFYLLLSFPLALASWVALVVVLALGGGLSITVVGIPLLLLAIYGWSFYADFERLLSNALLRTKIRPLPFGSERRAPNVWGRLKLRLKNPYTWRSLLYLLAIRFPMGIAGLVVVAATLGVSIQLILTPLHVAAGIDNQVFSWRLDSASDSAIALPLGILLLPVSLHVARWAGALAGAINSAVLQSPETSTPQPWGDALDRATRTAVAWPGVWAIAAREGGRQRRIQMRVWTVHLSLYLCVMLILLVINGLATPDTPWVLWPAWGWGIALALHTGYLVWGHLGGHLLAFAVTNVGFVAIDVHLADSTWFFWPLVAWAIAVAAHAYLYFGFAPVESEPLLEYDDQPGPR